MACLSRSGYVGPSLLRLVDEYTMSIRAAQARGDLDPMGAAAIEWIKRVAQELEVRRGVAADYAESNGATLELRTRLERDELRAQIIDFVEGVL